jgi:hypothetical protein
MVRGLRCRKIGFGDENDAFLQFGACAAGAP